MLIGLASQDRPEALQKPDDKLWADLYPQMGTALTDLQCLEATEC
jgi:hypothetical protein